MMMLRDTKKKMISKIKNIKLRYLFDTSLIKYEKSKRKYLFQIDKAKLNIYLHSPKEINMTGVKSFKNIVKYKKILEQLFKKEVKSIKIDCFFYSHKSNDNLKIAELYERLKDNKSYFIYYNPEIFCGIIIHPKINIYPTILLYRTGSYVMMGGRKLKQIYESEKFVLNIIDKVKHK